MVSVPRAPAAMQRAAIYVRVSSALQEREGSSLDTQAELCRAYAEQHGYVVDETHAYREVYTGVELWERPQLQRLRDAIRRHMVDVVVVYAIDRLSRDPSHLGVILSEADHAGVEVAFVSEVLDDSPEGQLIRFVRGYAAKIEHVKIKDRVMRGLRSRVHDGRPLAGWKAPYGYRWLPNVLAANGKPLIRKPGYEIDEPAAIIVRRIFADVLGGATLRAVAMALTAEGIPTPTGRPNWTHTTLNRILSHPIYCGRPMALRNLQETVRVGGKRRKIIRARPSDEQVELPSSVAPALVDEASFEAAAGRMRLNKEQSTRNNRAPEETLLRGGYIRCGYCGSAMIVRRDKANATRYRCGRSLATNKTCYSGGILVDVIDGKVWERMRAIILRPEIVAEELERGAAGDTTEADLLAIDREVKRIEKQQSHLIDQLAELGGAVGDMVRGKLATLESERERLLADRDGLATTRQAWQRAREQLGGFVSWCQELAKVVDTLTYAERRLALDAVQVRVRVWRPEHEPRYEIETKPGLDADTIVERSSRSTFHNVILRWTDRDAS